jgi:hypothetical protein
MKDNNYINIQYIQLLTNYLRDSKNAEILNARHGGGNKEPLSPDINYTNNIVNLLIFITI